MNFQNIKLHQFGSVLIFAAVFTAAALPPSTALATPPDSSPTYQPETAIAPTPENQPLKISQSVQTPAPAPVQLFERTTAINACRNSGENPLTVYSDTAQTQATGRLQPFTRLTLTGILGPGIAQIREPIVGWVQAATLQTNCNARPTPTPSPSPSPSPAPSPSPSPAPNPNPAKGACFRVLTNGGLLAFDTPGGAQQTFNGQADGPAAGDRVFATDPAQRTVSNDRRYIRVFYPSLNGSERLGWVAEGVVGGTNYLGTCPAN